MSFCSSCGAELPTKAAFCATCGSGVSPRAKSTDDSADTILGVGRSLLIRLGAYLLAAVVATIMLMTIGTAVFGWNSTDQSGPTTALIWILIGLLLLAQIIIRPKRHLIVPVALSAAIFVFVVPLLIVIIDSGLAILALFSVILGWPLSLFWWFRLRKVGFPSSDGEPDEA